jgi:hypothetical protein
MPGEATLTWTRGRPAQGFLFVAGQLKWRQELARKVDTLPCRIHHSRPSSPSSRRSSIRAHSRVIESARFELRHRFGDGVQLEMLNRALQIVKKKAGQVAAESVANQNPLDDEILAVGRQR